jgi:uroporphyrinogen-III synthase
MTRPLAGLRILVTRAAPQAEELAQPLREQGAEAILLPVIAIAPPANPQPLAQAIAQIDRYDWIVFTSTNAIRALGEKRGPARIATVGAATRAFAEQKGWQVDVTPDNYVAEALVEKLGAEEIRGKRILIPSAAVTRDVVRAELIRRGALVDVVEAYRNVIPPSAPSMAKVIFQRPFPDWITFASSSAVENLISLVTVETLRQTKIACLGPVTSNTVRQHALTVNAEPPKHTIPALVEALVQAVSSANTA